MMKSIALVIGLCCFSFGYSQNVFYDEDRPIKIQFNLESKVVHFDSADHLNAFLANIPSSVKVERVLSKYNAAVISIESNYYQNFSISDEFGIEGIKNETFAFQLEDGFDLWLSYELLLEPKAGINIDNTTTVCEALNGGSRLYQDEYGGYHLTVQDPLASLMIANELVEAGLVNWAHPNFYSNHVRYNDPLYSQQFQMNNTGQTISGVSGVSDIDCDAPEAWALTTGSSSIEVAVIDDGVEDHPDLEDGNGNSRLEAGNTPATGGDGSPILSSDAHGTACAGIISASHNSINVRGVAPDVQLRSINIFQGSETVSDLANAFNYARTQGSDVISNSWGYTSCTLSLSALNSAINNARNNGRGGLGCVIVFASGNGYKTCVDYPADLSYVLAVGAVTSLGTHSNYANQGPTLDLVAPSNSAPGQSGPGVRTLDRVGSAGYSSGNTTSGFGGTSAACPVVAGCAALVLSYDPTLTELEVRNLLENTATDMGASGFDNTYGHGRVSAFDALTSLNPQPVGCTAAISSFPYSESFESGLGDWSQETADDFNWTVNSGSTPSSGTGPGGASDGSQYIYTESSSPNYPNKNSVLNSPCFDLNTLSDPELSFDYHMSGVAMGSLTVEGSVDGSTWVNLFSISGNQGDLWNSQSIDLGAYTNESEFRIRFNVLTANSYTSDVAIDNISLGNSDSSGNNDPCSGGSISAYPYSESFEGSTGDFIQSNNDDLDWTINSGGTPSNGTGPSGASDGNEYIYLEASSPNFPNKTAILELSCVDLSSLTDPALVFDYHMTGNAVGTLAFEGRESGGSWISLLSLNGDQGSSWNTGVISLSDFIATSDFELRIIGTTSSSWAGDISIDALTIGENPGDGGGENPNCANTLSLPYSEGFETSQFDWVQDSADDIDWTRTSGSTPSTSTGPTSAVEGSFYMYIEASSPNFPSKTARLTSDCFDLNQLLNPEIRFFYHMYGSDMGSLTLEINSTGTWQPLWSLSGDQGNEWKEASISLDAYSSETEAKFRFTGITGTSFRSDMAIDNIRILSETGSSNPTPCPSLNFAGQVVSFGGSQDNGTFSVNGTGSRVNLNDNAWKALPMVYTVTPNTMLELEFRSASEGEIQGIGFDSDNNISSDLSFQFHGTQNWGIQNFNDYTGSDWVSYTIPVGSFYTGTFDKLTLINDNDAGSGNEASFRNVKVYEAGDCDPGITASHLVTEIEIAHSEESVELEIEVFPNPTRNEVNLYVPDYSSRINVVRITDITGQTLKQFTLNSSREIIGLSELSSGIYLIRVEGMDGYSKVKRLIISR